MSHPEAGRVDAPEAPTDPNAERPTDPSDEQATDPRGDAAPTALEPAVEVADGEEPREPTLDTAPDRSLREQAARTDAALGAWRHESQRRNAEWEERSVAEEVERSTRRQRMGAAAILGGSAALSTLVLGTVFALLAFPALRHAAAPAAPIEVAAETSAPEPAPARPAEVAPSPVEEVAEAVAPAPPVAAQLPETPMEAGPPVSEARVAVVGDWVWTEFSTPSPGAVTLRWRDALHRPVLEPMGCGGPMVGGQRRCEAGRSRLRLDNAVRSGATPGTWTAEACLANACTPLGSFPVPIP